MVDQQDSYAANISEMLLGNGSGNGSTAEIDYYYMCLYRPKELLSLRFWLVAVCGTIISTVSVLENALLVYMFVTRPRFRTTHLYYMSWLAFSDIFMAVSYVMLLSVYKVLVDYIDSLRLYNIVITYLRPMFAVSVIAMVSSSNLICAASIERCFRILTRTQSLWNWMRSNRLAVAMFCMGLGVITRGSVYFEFVIVHNQLCVGTFGEYRLGLNDALMAHPIYTVYRFYVRNIVTVLLPFAILFCTNGFIVFKLRTRMFENKRRQSEKVTNAAMYHALHKQASMNLNSATRMLVLVVVTYLLARALDVFITVWEYIDSESLNRPEIALFYTLSVDLISLLTVGMTTTRLPIYYLCNNGIRHEIKTIIRNGLNPTKYCGRKNRKRSSFLRKQEKIDWNAQFARTWETEAREESSSAFLQHNYRHYGQTNGSIDQNSINRKTSFDQTQTAALIEAKALKLNDKLLTSSLCDLSSSTVEKSAIQMCNEYTAVLNGLTTLPYVDELE